MNPIVCAREDEILQAIVAGRWPDGCDPEQKAHVLTCGVCADLIAVAVALSDDRQVTARDARVPAPGAVWWKARRRIRQDALRASHRTVALVQGAVLGSALVVAGVVLSAASMLPHDWVGSMGRWFGGIDPAGIMRGIRWSLPLFAALLAWLAMVRLAARVATTED